MKKHSMLAIGLLLVSGNAFAQRGAGRPETFQKIDVPGAVVTIASGINNDGYIVGWYCAQLPCNGSLGTEANPRIRGFVQNTDGSFTYLNANDCPSPQTNPPTPCNHATGTQPRYISPQGVVIGAYLSEPFKQPNGITAPRFRGFAWYQGTFTFFDAPDVDANNQPVYDNPSWPHSIIPRAINARGEIVGCIHDKDQMDSMHGFRLHEGNFTRLEDPSTMNNGVNAKGELVGLDFMMLSGYRRDDSGNIVERISFSGADETDAWDINARGEIVGQAITNNFTVGHAFLRSKQGDYRYIEPPDVFSASCLANSSTRGLPCTSVAFAIADSGNVVGQYRDSFANCSTTACVHGFLLQFGDE